MLPLYECDRKIAPYKLPTRLDTLNSARIATALSERVQGSRQALIVDARALAYISSKGVHTLQRLDRMLQEKQGRLVLVGPQSFAREVLTAGGLGDALRPVGPEAETAAHWG